MARVSQYARVGIVSLLLATSLASITAATPQNKSAQSSTASQQDKAKACNNLADNKGLKGDDRKNFIQDCLSKAGNQQLSEMSQKDKMNTCKNLADRKNLTGHDRTSFIKDCMNKADPK